MVAQLFRSRYNGEEDPACYNKGISMNEEISSYEKRQLEDKRKKEHIKKHFEAGWWFYREGEDPHGAFDMKYCIIGKSKYHRNRSTYYVSTFYNKSDLAQAWGMSFTSQKLVKILLKGNFIPGGKYPMIPR